MSHINVGLYDNDSYGGTAWRECIDLGCLPLSLNIFEYKRFFDFCDYPFKVDVNFSNLKQKLNNMLDYAKDYSYFCSETKMVKYKFDFGLRNQVLKYCSYESTTPEKMKKVGLL